MAAWEQLAQEKLWRGPLMQWGKSTIGQAWRCQKVDRGSPWALKDPGAMLPLGTLEGGVCRLSPEQSLCSWQAQRPLLV